MAIPMHFVEDQYGIIWETDLTYQNAIEECDARASNRKGIEYAVIREKDGAKVHTAYHELCIV